MTTRKIIVTEDGSHSLFVPSLNETYHSTHGAIQESQHVFIRAGLDYYLKNHSCTTLNIFEVGFGTGLNALLTWKYATEKKISVHFTTIEAFPLDKTESDMLNYPDQLGKKDASDIFNSIHEAPWESSVKISDFFSLQKINMDLRNYLSDPESFHIIFFDAFAPNKQPEMWSSEILEKICKAMKPEGVFTTYCARGQLKRDLKAAGMDVQTLEGPPGKNEMVRAVKI